MSLELVTDTMMLSVKARSSLVTVTFALPVSLMTRVPSFVNEMGAVSLSTGSTVIE